MVLTVEYVSRIVEAHRDTALFPRLARVKSVIMHDASCRAPNHHEEQTVADFLWILSNIRPRHAVISLALTRTVHHFEQLCFHIRRLDLTSLEILGWYGFTLEIVLQLLPLTSHRLATLVLRSIGGYIMGRPIDQHFPMLPANDHRQAFQRLNEIALPRLVYLEFDDWVMWLLETSGHREYANSSPASAFPTSSVSPCL